MIIPPPRPHTKLQKCNKASKITRQTHEHTRTHPLTYNIVQKLIVCSGIETTTAAQRHTNKNLHILTYSSRKIFAHRTVLSKQNYQTYVSACVKCTHVKRSKEGGRRGVAKYIYSSAVKCGSNIYLINPSTVFLIMK